MHREPADRPRAAPIHRILAVTSADRGGGSERRATVEIENRETATVCGLDSIVSPPLYAHLLCRTLPCDPRPSAEKPLSSPSSAALVPFVLLGQPTRPRSTPPHTLPSSPTPPFPSGISPDCGTTLVFLAALRAAFPAASVARVAVSPRVRDVIPTTPAAVVDGGEHDGCPWDGVSAKWRWLTLGCA